MLFEKAVADGSEDNSSWNDDPDETGLAQGERLDVVCRRDGVCGDVFSWWWHQVERFPLLTPERERQLAAQVRAGDHAAFEEMVECNIRLVIAVAKRCNAYSSPTFPLIDLIQEGTIGLMKAARKFDHRRGYRFSTYATYWIRQAIMRAMSDTGRTIRLPAHVTEKIQRAERVRVTMTHSLLRMPTNAELAQYMDVPLERLQQLFEGALEPMSLDVALLEESDLTSPGALEERLADWESPSTLETALDSVVRNQICETLRSALGDLPKREAEVISLLYGLNGSPPLTVKEVAAHFSVSRERIRQLENAALKRLRACGTLREAASHM